MKGERRVVKESLSTSTMTKRQPFFFMFKCTEIYILIFAFSYIQIFFEKDRPLLTAKHYRRVVLCAYNAFPVHNCVSLWCLECGICVHTQRCPFRLYFNAFVCLCVFVCLVACLMKLTKERWPSNSATNAMRIWLSMPWNSKHIILLVCSFFFSKMK